MISFERKMQNLHIAKQIKALSVLFLMSPVFCNGQVTDVMLRGYDDGVKSSRQNDYQEAVLNAKLMAIERAGGKLSSFTQVENFQVKYDMVETKSEAYLLPGYNLMDMGYQEDGAYLVILSGRIKYAEEVKPGSVKLVINNYKDMRQIGDNISNDLVNDGGGIHTYNCVIFPAEYIASKKEKLNNLLSETGFSTMTFSGVVKCEINADDNENRKKAMETLKNGEPISLSSFSPLAIELWVPAGKYFIDYSLTLNGQTHLGKNIAPTQYYYDDNYFNWGPHEFEVNSGQSLTIIVTPNGRNACNNNNSVDLNKFISYLILNNRTKRYIPN
jgi:hypothetical protein